MVSALSMKNSDTEPLGKELQSSKIYIKMYPNLE